MTEISIADLSSPDHSAAIMELLDAYARDVMGGGSALSTFVKTNLISELQKRSNCVVVLAWVEGTPAGVAICFEAFSTFSCKPILNVHDFAVAPNYRGRGLSQKMLAKVQEIAHERGCCKLTLEVLEGNKIAQSAYKKFGFASYTLDPEAGRAMFFEKKLSVPSKSS